MADEGRIRLDTRLVQLGLAGGREKAKELIAAGQVTVNGRGVTKASAMVAESDAVACAAPPEKYVGRGGYKLEKALQISDFSLTDRICMDVGASTGGFTDCMLQQGAAHVFAVDVGHDQLHGRLRADARVTSLEGMDIRSPELTENVPPGTVDFASVDVSFVSLGHILPAVLPFLTADAGMVCLIKPQFEAGKSAVGKRGVVKDPKAHLQVLQAQLALFAGLGLNVQQLTFSPITGGEGNIEYLAVLMRGVPARPVDPAAVVQQAHGALRRKR